MTDRIPKWFLVAAGVLIIGPILAYFAYSRPGYFTNEATIEGLLLIEVLAAAVWMYRRVFFPIIVVSFLFAGLDVTLSSVFTSGRWAVLIVGATVGLIIVFRDRGYRFGMFHVLALFAVLSALTSGAVSRFGSLSFMKVLSLFLLFLYAATGARAAVRGRESQFFSGLLTGCEIFVAVIAATYLTGKEIMGNPNSLGAVMGVVAAPILLWGLLLKQEPLPYWRRVFLYGTAMYLTVTSHARAGMLAGFLSCALLCLALRRYRLLAFGIGVVAILVAGGAIFRPEAFSRAVSSATSMVYKSKNPNEGVLASRQSPWEDTIDEIHRHFWFGSGFGTSDAEGAPSLAVGKFSTTSATSAEHGSSFLAITAWVGMLGVVPFFLLLASLLRRIIRTLLWMWRTGNAAHPAIPLAIVMIAGLIHAGFEDWLFAPGYYLCMFYWSLAFMLVDLVPSLDAVPAWHSLSWRPDVMRQEVNAVATGR